MKHSARQYACCLIVLTAGMGSDYTTTSAQPMPTISFQGVLTDTGGNPVADGSYNLTISLYEQSSGGAAVWAEANSVNTSSGVFHAILGDVQSLADIKFSKDLWIGVKVGADPEMTPRTYLTSAPKAIGLVKPYRDTLEIETGVLTIDGTESVNEDLTIRAFDALIGLYSNSAGLWGSGIQMGEIQSGLVDKWSMARLTRSAGASLLFTYGTLPEYSHNPYKVRFDTLGTITAGGYEFSSTKFRYLQLPMSAFRSDPNYVDWTESDNGYIWIGSAAGGTLRAPVLLPDGAEIKSVTLRYMDNDQFQDINFDYELRRQGLTESSAQSLLTRSFTSTGFSGAVKADQAATVTGNDWRFVNDATHRYWINMDWSVSSGSTGSTSSRFYGMTIEYWVTSAVY